MHAPMRTCVGCRAVRPQAELLRARLLPASGPEGGPGADEEIVPDMTLRAGAKRHGRTVSGRSAYVCPARACLERAARRGGYARAFGRRKLAVDPTALWAAHSQEVAAMIELLSRSGGAAAAPRVQRLAALASSMRAAVGRVS